jgi:uncharacterized repeat protein (TIGR01451 family)
MMKHKLLLSFYLILGFLPVFAQNITPAIEWQKCFGSSGNEGDIHFPSGHDFTENNSAIPTSDGGIIFITQAWQVVNDGDLTGVTPKGGWDIWVVKLNAYKTIEWQKLLGGSKNDLPSSIIQANDGGYLMVGGTSSNDGNVAGYHGTYGNDAWIVKLSASGDIQWQKSIGGSQEDKAISASNTSDGGFIVAGFTNSSDGDFVNFTGGTDGILVKLSATGAIQWLKNYGGDYVDILKSVRQTSDGGYITAGMTNSVNFQGVSNNNHSRVFDVLIIKLTASGNVEWHKELGGVNEDYANSIILTADGGYAIVGQTDSFNDGDVIGGHGTVDVTDIWFVKLSNLGDIQWQKVMGGRLEEGANALIQTADKGYLIGGFAKSSDGDVIRGQNEFGNGWLVKLTEQGSLQWQKTIGGTAIEKINAIFFTADGGWIAAGSTESNDFDVNGNHGGIDAWIVKFSPDTKVLIGQVQQNNTICQSLTPPQYIANALVKIEKRNVVYFISTDSLGRFGLLLDTGNFKINVQIPNNLWTDCLPKSIILSNPNIRDTTIVYPSLFINSICPQMEAQLTTPFLRRCFESTYTINYANKGTAIQNDATAELTLDSALTFVSATRPVRSRVGNKVVFSLGNVGINQAGQFTVNVLVSCDSRLGQTHCSSVLIPKTMTCDTVQDSIPTIVNQCVAGCDSISFLINKPNTTLNRIFKYQLIADAALIDTGRFTLTNTFNLKHKRDGRTYRLEIRNPVTNQLLVARSVESNPTASTPSVSTGFVNQFANAIKQTNIAENCTTNRGAYDPNDKAAIPTGIGTAHFIEQGKEIEYLVQFQNTGTDTAFKVVVKDTLAAHFNLSTFKLNASSHAATWQLNPKGVLVVTFNNINLVDSFTNEKKSHGFFKYSIKLNDSTSTNTIVTNKAAIYFDFNAPIITNLISHTIGKELIKNCLIKPTITVNYSGCPSRNIVFTATAKNAGLTPTYAWYRNNETGPLSINAVFTLNNAVKGTKIYCKTTASTDICTDVSTITSDTIILNCIGVATNDLNAIVQSFDVYPNPNKGIFTIKLNTIKSELMQLNILNYLGQTIKSELINSDSYSKEFNLSNVPNGIYLIKLTINGQSISKKISVF